MAWRIRPYSVSTVVTYHPATRLHQAWAGHPERPERIEAVLEALRAPAMAPLVTLLEAAPAERTTLERVHPAGYLDALEALAAAGGGPLDGDTYLGPRSWDAVRASAGVALRAVEEGVAGGTAFAATRPPGHHALAARAMGFCFVNNVVVAARHAQVLGAARVLIVDWDVHHGNGTQALVEGDPSIRYVSLHQSPWYPGTGAAEERGVGNVFNVPRPPVCRARSMCAISSTRWTLPSKGGSPTRCSSRRVSTRSPGIRWATSRCSPRTSCTGPPSCGPDWPAGR